MADRKSGILLHISSLPGAFGIGDLGPGAYQFVDFLVRANQTFWQILPINPTDPISKHSPYSSGSAFAGNTLFISPEFLVRDDLLDPQEIEVKPAFKEGLVDYERVVNYKTSILKKAFTRFITSSSAQRAHKNSYQKFMKENAFWLKDYAFYVTMKEHFNGKIWSEWPEELRDRDQAALANFGREHAHEIDLVFFSQYIFFRQWGELKDYCVRRGICLFGDLAIYMNLDSAEVWRFPKNYKLDDQFHPVAVAGVPPDYFSKTGQRWGNPVYDWAVLQASGFAWWMDRFRFNFKLFDVVRIDHFRGMVQYWEIPAEEETAVNGQWVDVPTDAFFGKLKETFGDPLPIVAEDLGDITNDVRDAMQRFRFPGMKILLFAFNGDMQEHPYLPHNFTSEYVVYTGTHDNNTVVGWFSDEASDQEVENLREYIGRDVSDRDIHWDFIELALTSEAKLAMIPMQDLLGLGSDARMNTPSTTEGNWCWRLRSECLEGDFVERLRRMTSETGRV